MADKIESKTTRVRKAQGAQSVGLEWEHASGVGERQESVEIPSAVMTDQ
jgi:hypothetical protein